MWDIVWLWVNLIDESWGIENCWDKTCVEMIEIYQWYHSWLVEWLSGWTLPERQECVKPRKKTKWVAIESNLRLKNNRTLRISQMCNPEDSFKQTAYSEPSLVGSSIFWERIPCHDIFETWLVGRSGEFPVASSNICANWVIHLRKDEKKELGTVPHMESSLNGNRLPSNYNECRGR